MSDQLEFGLNWEGFNLNFVEPRKSRVIVSPDESPTYGKKQIKSASVSQTDLGICRRCKVGRVRIVQYSELGTISHYNSTGKWIKSEPRCDYCF